MLVYRVIPVIWISIAIGLFRKGEDGTATAFLCLAAFLILATAVIDDYYDWKEKRNYERR